MDVIEAFMKKYGEDYFPSNLVEKNYPWRLFPSPFSPNFKIFTTPENTAFRSQGQL
jgi:hypothetical protein